MKLFASFLLVALFAVSAVAADEKAAAKVAKPDLAKGEASYGTVCAACHGADGNSVAATYPILAGQHATATAAVIPNWYRKRPAMLDMNETGAKITTRLSVVGASQRTSASCAKVFRVLTATIGWNTTRSWSVVTSRTPDRTNESPVSGSMVQFFCDTEASVPGKPQRG